MTFSRPNADVYAPDGTPPELALARTTHLCVGAHQDDIEIMAHSAIAECHGAPDKFFTGVVVTDGAGSPRAGRYADYTDAQMQAVRREEQRRAAALGKYNLQIQLAHSSADVKFPDHPGLAADLSVIFGVTRPQVVYLHNPADKHDTHVAVVLRCLGALRALARSQRPSRVLGCEVWRGLDWLPDADKVALDDSRRPELAESLLKVFESQIDGGKRYDLATLGRRAANATYRASHQTDSMSAITWAMDLTPLVVDETLSIAEYVLGYIERLRAEVAGRLEAFGGQG